ncbi:CRISPR-associated endonuclease Cas2 [Marinithermus hydrothermalis]|uniref:CRISPR-associated endoribonuclease Cas2 n=1 Tax=Marinithermus hydrothermalis (strain DSM 14884 / JCM 11576 / T1) TaxID=869210 RepID=F2NN57_MARHT|nr:CRISPR-associated endonuclease Cas2 [Marinithermus hydrothermalis]AEB12796.1 CRISPR-associated protein Cas2 [Marinithermus hydrothermalis DSM 14884]
MYVIMAYDVNVERVVKVLHTGRRYLTWVQNSVLEGELTPALFERLKADIAKIIDPNQDAVRFYVIKRTACFEKEFLGHSKNEPGQIL